MLVSAGVCGLSGAGLAFGQVALCQWGGRRQRVDQILLARFALGARAAARRLVQAAGAAVGLGGAVRAVTAVTAFTPAAIAAAVWAAVWTSIWASFRATLSPGFSATFNATFNPTILTITPRFGGRPGLAAWSALTTAFAGFTRLAAFAVLGGFAIAVAATALIAGAAFTAFTTPAVALVVAASVGLVGGGGGHRCSHGRGHRG